MKTYWDYPEDERADLTREQVTELLRFERMEHGCIVPPEPEPPPEKPRVDLKTSMYYAVAVDGKYSGPDLLPVVFEDREDAEKVCRMRMWRKDYDFRVGTDYSYAVPNSSASIEEVVVYDKNDLDRVREILAAHKEAKDAYHEGMSEYREAVNAAEKCCESVWEDYSGRVAERMRLDRIRDTYSTYLADCDGNDSIARKFLVKAFTDADEVAKAIGASEEP